RYPTIAIAVLQAHQFVEPILPHLSKRSPIDRDPQPNHQRPQGAEKNEVLNVGGARALGGALGPCWRSGRQQGQPGQAAKPVHPRISAMGLAEGSTTRIGRATFDKFCFIGSIPNCVQTVASRSGTETGRSCTVVPSGLVRPMSAPPLMPPPASTVLHA